MIPWLKITIQSVIIHWNCGRVSNIPWHCRLQHILIRTPWLDLKTLLGWAQEYGPGPEAVSVNDPDFDTKVACLLQHPQYFQCLWCRMWGLPYNQLHHCADGCWCDLNWRTEAMKVWSENGVAVDMKGYDQP